MPEKETLWTAVVPVAVGVISCSKRMTHSGNLLSTVNDLSATTSVKVILASGPFLDFSFPVEPEANDPVIEEERTSGSHVAHAGTFA